MKKTLTVLLAVITLTATAQIRIPQASTAGTVTSVVGLTDVKIDYSRPKIKGRKIFGDGADFLLPYGKIWRTGANSGTRITFSEDVKVEGIAVPKGTYLIFSWPGASEWSISLYKDLDLGGNTAKYDAKNEQAKFTVKSEKLAERIETLTFQIGDISDDNTSAKVQIAWENTSVKFTVNADYDASVMKEIEAGTKVNPENLIDAAQYYFNNKKDMKQALAWVDQYFANGQHANEFWNINLKAKIQKALGDKAGAIASAKKSIEVAKANQGGDFGYVKMNEDLITSLK